MLVHPGLTLNTRLPSRLARIVLVTAALTICSAGAASAAVAGTLYVSPGGNDAHGCSRSTPCRTIARALAHARTRDTVMVASGTYREGLTITKDVRIIGVGDPVLDAAGNGNGFLIQGAGADGASVLGFTIVRATFEGILASRTSRISIIDDVVKFNDQGANARKPTGECASVGPIPGDCGEGIHLLSVTHARVLRDTVTANEGGILLTDELGPTADNLISRNRAVGNAFDCGITLAGHNPRAISADGTPQPAIGGVFDNTISDNIASDNGRKGQGAGIVLAGPLPGIGVYSNTITRNTAIGNGLPGVTLHSHAPGQDLNGNIITNNVLSHDGVAGFPNGAPGDSDVPMHGTAGILIWSAARPLKGTVIRGNRISHVRYGIWTQNVPAIRAHTNVFGEGVTTPIFQK